MTKQEVRQAVSPALEEAQAQLLAIRAQLRSAPVRLATAHGPSFCRARIQSTDSDQQITQLDPRTIADLPGHLGWGSQRLSEQMRRTHGNRTRHTEVTSKTKPSWVEELSSHQPPALVQSSTKSADAGQVCDLSLSDDTWLSLSTSEIESGSVNLHPTIGLGILRSKLAAPGRIWLLLRWIDKTGSGQIEIEHARSLFCSQESTIKVCGWRQLRNLLAQGEGIFWNQNNGRLWLRSVPKVAQSLNTERLSGYPVDLPVKTLLRGIGQVRAHLFASFHSGRKRANPISRASLNKISHVSPRSQQNYETQAQVRKQKNYAIGPQLSDDNAQNQGWRHGSACFKWHDHKGTFGAQKDNRLAWQLPNSYFGPHARRPRGQQRQLNRELAVLSTKGMTGNDQFTGDTLSKRYFDVAAEAIRTLDQSQTGLYWRGERPGQWYFWDSKGSS